MNKYYLRLMTLIIMVVLTGIGLAACGDDDNDDDNGGRPNTNVGNIEDTGHSSSIIGTWRWDWGDEPECDYTAYSFFDDDTGVMFDKGNGAERFTYTYDIRAKVVSIVYDEYQKEDMVVSELTPSTLVMDGNKYKKIVLTNDMLILGEWYLHVDAQNSTGKGSRVMFKSNGTYEAKDYTDSDAQDEWYHSFSSLNGKVSGTYTITSTSISIKGSSQIGGDYIIDGLVVNGCRFIKAANPDDYPYLLGGWHNR